MDEEKPEPRQRSSEELERHLLEMYNPPFIKAIRPILRMCVYTLVIIGLYYLLVPKSTRYAIFGDDHFFAMATISFMVGVTPSLLNFSAGAGRTFDNIETYGAPKEVMDIEMEERKRMWSGFTLGIGPYTLSVIFFILYLLTL